MLNIYFTPIHVQNHEGNIELARNIAMLEELGSNIVNTEARGFGMIEDVDAVIGDFSYGDRWVEKEVLLAAKLGKPVLALVSRESGLVLPEAVENDARSKTNSNSSLTAPLNGYASPDSARGAIRAFHRYVAQTQATNKKTA